MYVYGILGTYHSSGFYGYQSGWSLWRFFLLQPRPKWGRSDCESQAEDFATETNTIVYVILDTIGPAVTDQDFDRGRH